LFFCVGVFVCKCGLQILNTNT